ncbi:hypothetical protein NEOC65_001814 [Neochlamydia sp. AcF65]|nr:hypothetical protein [Neochlamydia sp. AcF65]MBS4171488.1 hypothetical protein [Neochlamydia sp. AcF95]
MNPSPSSSIAIAMLPHFLLSFAISLYAIGITRAMPLKCFLGA